jgi:LytS/YehU family sensor histidine kinase
MAPITLVGTLIGYVGGNALAQALIGSSGQKLVISPFLLVVSLAAALAISYVFHARAYAQVLALKAEAAEHLAREAQLRVLQSQLEPHMLFNTLANLRALIGVDPPQAQAMLDHLIAFLRSTLAGTRVERHSLAAEFASLADYLALMQMRMGQRLAMRLDLPAELAGLPVPPLLLQPLVENAIRHGLEPRVEGGRVEVGARRVEGGLELRVRDTGVGLAPRAAHAAQAAQVPRMPPMPHAAGTPFGLEQVRQRLQRLYGDAARLTLQPAADAEGGTLAQIILPILPLPS